MTRVSGPEMAEWTRAIRRSALEEMLAATARPGLISLALGLPSPDLFPTSALGGAIARMLAGDRGALQYGPPSSELRAFVAGLMRRRGVTCSPEQIFLTAGAQQAMSLLSRLLLDPGSTVLVEQHCYTGFQQAISAASPRIVTVPTNLESGIDLGAVDRALGSGRPPSLLYAMSDGHNPFGVSMPIETRRRLVESAAAHGVPILEDDAYGLIAYDGHDLPALRAFDAEWVFYLGSFSKTLAPALRTGWVVVPERFVGPLSSLKESSDINTATLGQRAVAAFAASGGFDGHLQRLRTEYAVRRDAMLAAVARSFPAGSRWSRPRAGFFTWVELPDAIDAVSLFHMSLEREHVALLPGAAFVAGGAEPARSALRLSFSFCDPATITEGVARIARAIESMTRVSPKGAEVGDA